MGKKDKSDILSGMGSGFQIVKALRDAGASDDQLRTIIANDSDLPRQIVALLKGATEAEVKPGDTFMVTVDYTKSLADMIKVGKYDYVNQHIMEQNFPIQRPSVSEDAGEGGGTFRTPGIQSNNTELVLVHLNKVATTTSVLQHLDKQGLRPARIEELLALGEKYPDLQRQFPIVALGSVWVYSDGNRYVPCLYEDGSERGLLLGWDDPGDRWVEGYRFVAVS